MLEVGVERHLRVLGRLERGGGGVREREHRSEPSELEPEVGGSAGYARRSPHDQLLDRRRGQGGGPVTDHTRVGAQLLRHGQRREYDALAGRHRHRDR